MKRLTFKQKVRLRRLRARRERLKYSRQHLRRTQLRQVAGEFQRLRTIYVSRLSIELEGHFDRIPLEMPSVLSLSENYDATVSAVNELRDLVLARRFPVVLLFNRVTDVEPAAALLLTAEIFRCRNLRPLRGAQYPVDGNFPAHTETYLRLKEMGFYRLLGIPLPEEPEDNRSLKNGRVFLPFLTSSRVEPELADLFTCDVTSKHMEMDDQSRRYLYAALIEAMKNANEHAYKLEPEFQPMKGRYWFAGYQDFGRGELMVIVLDQGVGIPRTLDPDLFEWARLQAQNLAGSPGDGIMIRAATRMDRTRTRQLGRGQGFATMKKFVDSCEDGELTVLSNQGWYAYRTNKAEEHGDHDVSIFGTLIQWRFQRMSPGIEVRHD